jgi:hypothetical protein
METMTTKKTTTKKTARRRPTMKDPARSIIADAEGYDEDTRMAVQASLDRNDAKDLAETVNLAESRGIILDTTPFQERDERGAAAILALMDSPDVPEFIRQAVRDALTLAENIIGTNYVSRETGKFTPDALANLVRSLHVHAIKGEVSDAAKKTEAEAFAHHMGEALRIALNSDHFTARFYNHLAEAWSDNINEFKCYQDASLTESAEFIRLALKMEAERKEGAR